MEYNQFDEEELNRRSEEAKNKKMLLGALGAAADNYTNVPTAYELLKGKSIGQKSSLKSTFDSLASNVEDPWEKQKKTYELYKGAREAKKGREEDTLLAGKKDPNSKQSMSLKALAPRWGLKVTPEMSAYDIEQMIDPKKMMETEAQSQVSFDNARKLKAIEHGYDMDKVRNQDNAEKETTFGLARTKDDAKQLKEAAVAKSNFDNKLKQMISLREKHKGGALLNREDVARGKQLSKDLLLEYKNMAKLGVLSQADENIINAIIPEDPLVYNSPLAAIQGQDPTLSRLKSFQSDANKDFEERLKQRLAPRAFEQHSANQELAPQDDGLIEVQSPDGRVKRIPRNKVNAALAAGGKLTSSMAQK